MYLLNWKYVRCVLICDSAFTMKGFKSGTPSPLNGKVTVKFLFCFTISIFILTLSLALCACGRSDIGQI